MKKSHFLTAAVWGGLLTAAISVVFAQARPGGAPVTYPPRQPALGPVALIDVSKVFKEHPRFKQEMDSLKLKVEQVENQMRKDAETLRLWVEELKSFKPGSTDYKDRERRIAERRSELNVQAQLTRKEFLQQEANVYYRIYREVEYQVADWAKRNNIQVVLRFNSDQVDQENPDEVLRFINKPVVFSSPTVDITNVIINSLKARSTAPPVRPRVGSRPPQGVPYPPTQR